MPLVAKIQELEIFWFRVSIGYLYLFSSTISMKLNVILIGTPVWTTRMVIVTVTVTTLLCKRICYGDAKSHPWTTV
ncbi:hypothetical protein B0H19DRAFT_1112912 [Mycena capillaripes]|nr:hypothetical protein B0H19DRAFT_1112912 [Mycena capillaripes]